MRPSRPEEIKDYSSHPDFVAFCYGQPQPDSKDPENQKKMWIASDFITMCLEAAGIVIEGNGRKEFAQMDPEYRGIVRFKEFKKFCKHFRLQKQFVESDSSYSCDSDEIASEVIKELWQEIDLDHQCEVPKMKVFQLLADKFGICDPKDCEDKELVDAVLEGWDVNNDGNINF